MIWRIFTITFGTVPFACALAAGAVAQTSSAGSRPWMDSSLSPGQRASAVLGQMTLDEKIALLHGEGMRDWPNMSPAILGMQAQSNGGAGFVPGVPRLGIPPIQMSDAAYGVRSSAENGRYSTALPSNLASAASWDPQSACAYGRLIGQELRAQGYNMTLGGGVNLTRELRNGRTFEYMGEDPLLAGTLVGERIRCEGAEHVISDIKHYALNDQESGRNKVDVRLGERAMRESDLLAFEIGLQVGQPKAVMCSYNGVNGDYACENKYLLTDVLKNGWKFPGFVVSDWGATHSVEKASAAGLDQEQPLDEYFGPKLKDAVQAGRVPVAELDDHVRRVLWAEFASGIVDHPMRRQVVDVEHGFEVARRTEEQGAVLLRNRDALLPLDAGRLRSIVLIGAHTEDMISGGGSAQVDPPGAMAGRQWRAQVWFPTSPLQAIRAKVPGAQVSASGSDIAQAVAAARRADVAVVFASQWEAEDADLASLSLPENQDALIAAVAAANPHTVVVLETGTAVTMPWLQSTGAVLEAWYGGSRGADAVANLLFGDVNPSGKLPMTFPMSEADLPRARESNPARDAREGVLSFQVDYNTEGARVGYKWYATEHKPVLFPFGFGLSYTTFAYSGLKTAADGANVTLTVTNTGKRKGADVVQVYATLPPASGETWDRLAGWQKVELAPGESRAITVPLNRLTMSVWDEAGHRWAQPPGAYRLRAGGSSVDLPVEARFTMGR